MLNHYFKKICKLFSLKRPAARRGYGLLLLMVFMASVVMMGTSLQLMTGSSTINYLGKTSQSNLAAQELATTALATVTSYVQTQLNSNATVNTSYFATPTTVTMPADPTALGGGTVNLGSYTATITARGNSYLLRVTGTVGGASATVTNVVNVGRNSYLLDSMSNANVAYGLRKLRSGYTGSAIRVRRGMDNTEQDIGFLPNGDLDIYSLYDFLLVTANDTTRARTPLNAISPSSIVAFGLRCLEKSYTGNLIRVRRSSDSTTLDIGCDANGDLDVNALMAFVGTGTGYVTIWYDQSGNGTNATQATAGFQPTIVTNGVLNMVNNRPAILYDGTDDNLEFNRTIGNHFSILACFSTVDAYTDTGKDEDVAGTPYYAGLVDADEWGVNTQDFGISIDANGRPHFGTDGNDNTGFHLPTPGALNDGRMHWLAMTRNNSTGMVNGYTDTGSYSKMAPTGLLTASSTITIGRARTTYFYFNGYINEVLLYASTLSQANRLTLARNEEAYYNIASSLPSTSNPINAIGTTPAVACGLRRLRSAYGGSAIQVRSSAGGTTNIGFTFNGDLDVPALMSFVGNNSAYVTTCYDQASGSSRNLSQGTAANQPRIVNAGTLEMLNGRPAMYFDGNDYLTYATGGAAFYSSNALTAIAMFNVPAASTPTTDYSRILSAYNAANNDWDNLNSSALLEAYGNYVRTERNSGSIVTPTYTYNVPTLASSKFSAGTGYVYLNGGLGSSLWWGTNNFSLTNVRLGGSSGLQSGETLLGYLTEAYLYTAALSDIDRGTIEKNVLQYYRAAIPAGYVSTWYDQSGNGNHAVQVVPALQPTISLPRYGSGNIRPTVNFDGTQGLISLTGMPTSSNYTKNVVYSYYDNTATNNPLSSTTDNHAFGMSGGTTLNIYHAGTVATSATLSLSTLYSMFGTFNNATTTGLVYTNNVAGTSGTTATTVSNAAISLGSHRYHYFLKGTISEALIFNRILSTTDRTAIYNDQCDYYGSQ
jgi:Alpha-L-arabinofuranosidase B, catalytic/Concanavalin A-like lectin/glucanases superfamily